jgi:hypothetical protein
MENKKEFEDRTERVIYRILDLVDDSVNLDTLEPESEAVIVEYSKEAIKSLVSIFFSEIIAELNMIERKIQENDKKWLADNDLFIDGAENEVVKVIHFVVERIIGKTKNLGIKV